MSNKFKAQLQKTLKDLQFDLNLEQKDDNKKLRHLELHPSSFPYCPLQTLLPVLSEGLYKHRWLTASFDYYTSVGTAVHTVMQKHFGRDMEVVGDWKCRKCGDVALFSTFNEAGYCCGKARHYEELGLKFKKTVRGHTDGLFKYGGDYWVGDYKTSSVKNIAKYEEDGNSLPYRSNREQIRSYLVLLEREYKIQIRGWALIYLARDNPFRSNAVIVEEFDDSIRQEYRKRMVTYDKQYDTMLDVDNNGKGMDYLISTKPCKEEKDYNELFGGGFEECPLKNICFDEHKLIKKFDKLIRESKYLPMRKLELRDDVPPKPVREWVRDPNWVPPKITEF